MSPPLRISLMGDLRIVHGSKQLPGIDNARTRSLLAYLILHRDAPQSRAQLSNLFWLDSAEAQGRAVLRKQIYHLRRALPDAKRYLLVRMHALNCLRRSQGGWPEDHGRAQPVRAV